MEVLTAGGRGQLLKLWHYLKVNSKEKRVAVVFFLFFFWSCVALVSEPSPLICIWEASHVWLCRCSWKFLPPHKTNFSLFFFFLPFLSSSDQSMAPSPPVLVSRWVFPRFLHWNASPRGGVAGRWVCAKTKGRNKIIAQKKSPRWLHILDGIENHYLYGCF